MATYAAGNDPGSFTSGLAPSFYVAAAMTCAAMLLALVTLTRPAKKPAPAPSSFRNSADDHPMACATTPEGRK
ncbi:hypothetical protein ACTMTF_49045 [Nonomuraea sp. ZG12]|uniref:hypothetical protein n=1 Tax=Nonomuraea sp. ZG12 TaxID=3452207 RepID=UPI003F89D43C